LFCKKKYEKMKIALKNFLTALRRYRTASLLNIAGLTLAFTAFYIIMAQVTYEVSFNRSIEDYERIFLVSPDGMAIAPLPTTEYAVSVSPEVESWGLLSLRSVCDRVWVERRGSFERFDIPVNRMSASMLDVMSFRTVEGDLHAMSDPSSAILSRNTAELLGVGVGDVVYLPCSGDNEAPSRPFTVAGIYDDFAENTLMGKMRIVISSQVQEHEHLNSTRNYSIYVKMARGAGTDRFCRIWEDDYRKWWADLCIENSIDQERSISVELRPLHKQYYSDLFSGGGRYEHGSAAATATLFGIALLIVTIAFINFVNFSFAMIPVRVRAVNVCKVFGAPTGVLRRNFIFESAGMAVCALLVSLWIMPAVSDSFISEYVPHSLALRDNLGTVAVLLAVVTVMSLLASLYPAWRVTSYNASLAAKGGYAGSASGRRLRIALIGMQFVVSMALIMVTGTFYLQYRFMVDYDPGFDRSNLLVFRGSRNIASRNEAFTAYIAGDPDVMGVTASIQSIIGRANMWGERELRGSVVDLFAWDVRHDFFDGTGIRIVRGENFARSSADHDIMISRNLHLATGADVGDMIGDYTVRGVFEDINLLSVADEGADCYLALVCANPESCRYFYVRLRDGADVARVRKRILEGLETFDPECELPEIETADRMVARMYGSARRHAVLIAMFAVLAVVISLMGVFGMVLFEMQHRRREIAVRRVFGASVRQMLNMLNVRYAVIVAVCFVAAAPVAWYTGREWLAGFAVRISMPWYMFVLSFAAVMAVTLGIVTWCSSRTAGENPSRVLGGE